MFVDKLANALSGKKHLIVQKKFRTICLQNICTAKVNLHVLTVSCSQTAFRPLEPISSIPKNESQSWPLGHGLHCGDSLYELFTVKSIMHMSPSFKLFCPSLDIHGITLHYSGRLCQPTGGSKVALLSWTTECKT